MSSSLSQLASFLFVAAVLPSLHVEASKRGKGGDFTAGSPTLSPTPKVFTYAPSPTEHYATEPPTGAQTITHNPDWTEAQLISVILGSVVGLTAVVLAVYCAYARGACEEGPKRGGIHMLPTHGQNAPAPSRGEEIPLFKDTERP